MPQQSESNETHSPNLCRVCLKKGVWEKTIEVQDIDSGEWFSVFECPNCRVLMTWPIPGDLSPYYAMALGQSFKKQGGAFYEPLKRMLLKRELKRMTAAEPSGPFLDIGCGSGDFTRIIYEGSHPVIAVDAEEKKPAAVFDIDEIAYHTMNYATYEIQGLKHAPYLAVLRHVLEHVKDPTQFLKKIMSYGTKYIYISVPNAASLTRYLFGQYWFMWDPPRHLWQFQRHNLESLLRGLDLKILAHGYDLSPTWVPSIYRFLCQKNAPPWMKKLFYSKGSLCGLLGPLDLLHPKNMIWVLCGR